MFSFAINVVFSQALALLLGMINSLQIIFHLPILYVVMPGNVQTLFQIMVPVVMFDILENFELIQNLFPDSEF